MHTIVDKHKPQPWERHVNEDGKVWTAVLPKDFKREEDEKEYMANIADSRLERSEYEGYGNHYAWAATIEELIDDIKSFNAPHYSENEEFLKSLIEKDKDEKRKTKVELYSDFRGTKIVRVYKSW
jgi:hypothetical protein